jgi:hypothetical protein
MSKNNRKCLSCPALKGEPCHFALERIHALQADAANSRKSSNESNEGCDWYINSAEHNYSFWVFAEELQGSPVPDKEICKLLMINQPQLREVYNSAIQKLAENKDKPYMKEFLDSVMEMVRSKESGNTEFVPDSLQDDIYDNSIISSADSDNLGSDLEQELDDLGIKKSKRGRKKKINGMGMPVHRSGNKVDLYGLSSKDKKK